MTRIMLDWYRTGQNLKKDDLERIGMLKQDKQERTSLKLEQDKQERTSLKLEQDKHERTGL
jgi:hypothetical protein